MPSAKIRAARDLALIIGAVLCLSCITAAADAGTARTWTNAKGQALKATYLKLDGADVELALPDGKTVKVKLADLSVADQTYVALLQPKLEAPAKVPAEIVLAEIPVPKDDTRGVFALDAGDFTVSFNDVKAKSLSPQQLRGLIQPLQAAAWALRELRCGFDPVKDAPKPQARFLTRDVMQATSDQAMQGFCRLSSFALEVAWNEVSSAMDPSMTPGEAVPAIRMQVPGGPPGTPPEQVAAIDAMANAFRTNREQRTLNLLAGGVRLMMREDALFLPPWVISSVTNCVSAMPREQGWPQVARLKGGIHQWLTAFSREEKLNPSGSLAADAMTSTNEAWQGDPAASPARPRLEAGALLLAYYFLQLDFGATTMWKGAVSSARADGAKLRAFTADVATYRTNIASYLKARGIIPRVDGSFSYNTSDPPPAAPVDPFPEVATQGPDVLTTRYSTKFATAFGKQDLAKSVDDAFARDGIPLGADFKPYQLNLPVVVNVPPPAAPTGAIVSAANRVPVDSRTWPLQIKVGLSAIEPNFVGGRYRCGRFEFSCDVPLPFPIVKEVSRTFTAVEELMNQLPWGITPTPAKGPYFQARLFSTHERYQRDGGPALSGGVYDLRDKIFRVPFESLGLTIEKGAVTRRKGVEFSLDTIIHELTHMMMDEMLPAMPIWVTEGSAEYTQMIPFKDGLFRFGDHADGMKAYVKKFTERNTMATADDCVKVLHLTTPAWHKAVSIGSLDPNATPPPAPAGNFIIVPTPGRPPPPDSRAQMRARLYCAATLLYYYFMHLDEPKRGRPMLPFLDAVQDDLPQWRSYNSGFATYRAQMDAFLKQPGVQRLADGRFSYPTGLTPPQPPTLPGGETDAFKAAQHHLKILLKGRSDDALREALRQKYAPLGIKL